MSQNEMFNIDHLGIAVKSLSAAKMFYQKLGLTVVGEETGQGTTRARHGEREGLPGQSSASEGARAAAA